MLQRHESGSRWHLTLRTQVRKLPAIVLEPAGAPLVEAGPAMGFSAGWDAMPLWAREPSLTR